MALRVRFDPIAQDLRIAVSGLQEGAAKLRGEIARRTIAQADQQNKSKLGRAPPKTVMVDGRLGAPLESVKPNGVIIAEWELFTDVLLWIGTELQKRSPVISGAYARSHLLFADGQEISLTENPEPAEEYVFLNPIPYARKIEIGKTKAGRNFVIQVPNRIYEGVAKDAKARFGNQADIRFSYRHTTGAYRLRRSQGRRRDRQAGSVVQAPAIIVKLRGN